MPYPKAGEAEKDYMGRCMSHAHTQKWDASQRAAVCHSMFKDGKKNRFDIDSLVDAIMNVAKKEEDTEEHQPAMSYEKSMGGEGFFTHCMESDKMCEGAGDKKACCAAVHEKDLGFYPSEEKFKARQALDAELKLMNKPCGDSFIPDENQCRLGEGAAKQAQRPGEPAGEKPKEFVPTHVTKRPVQVWTNEEKPKLIELPPGTKVTASESSFRIGRMRSAKKKYRIRTQEGHNMSGTITDADLEKIIPNSLAIDEALKMLNASPLGEVNEQSYGAACAGAWDRKACAEAMEIQTRGYELAELYRQSALPEDKETEKAALEPKEPLDEAEAGEMASKRDALAIKPATQGPQDGQGEAGKRGEGDSTQEEPKGPINDFEAPQEGQNVEQKGRKRPFMRNRRINGLARRTGGATDGVGKAQLPWALQGGAKLLQRLVQAAVRNDDRFKVWGDQPEARVVDLVPPSKGGWLAVVRTGEGTVSLPFEVRNRAVELSADEPEPAEVVMNRHAFGGITDRKKVAPITVQNRKTPPKVIGKLELLSNRGCTHLDLGARTITAIHNDSKSNGPAFALPADGWVNVAPRGEHFHPSSGLTQVIDDAALDSIVNKFAEERKSPNHPGLLLDFDHFSQNGNTSSEAAGWITGLSKRDDGLWAEVKWSDRGKEAVENGRYRLASPVWRLSDCEEVGEDKVRPLRLDTVALTNQPNLRGLVPLSNSKP